MNRIKSPIIEGAPIVGVTGTYYPDSGDIRFEIALDTAEGWSEQGLPLVVVDGSPDDKVAGALRARGATVLDAQRPGIASQRQQGTLYVLGQGGNKIITHEPETIAQAKLSLRSSSSISSPRSKSVCKSSSFDKTLFCSIRSLLE